MATPRAAAIYARISSDQEGTQLGVARQLEDCRKLAAELGWGVAEEYVDNDLSAYSGTKPRPGYQRLVADIEDGLRDGVLVYHVDRLTRRPMELEQFVDAVARAGVRHVRFVAGGDLDAGTGDGLLLTRVTAAVAANESDTKSRRVRRKMDQNAADGRPHGGARPFGYEDDKLTVRESEAAVIRELVERHLAGESLRSLALWLDAEGIPTARGGHWNTGTLRNMLASPRIAGLREHRGEVVGPAVWAPIITEQQRARVLALYAERAVTGRRSPRTYLLTGLLRCGRCEGRLYSSARTNRRRYVCMSGPDHRGCGRLTIEAQTLEDLLANAVLYRLDTPELADALAGRAHADERTAAAADALVEDRAQLEELAGLYATKAINMAEWIKARNIVEARIAQAERTIARATRSDALAGLVGHGEQLRTQWADLPLSRRHAIIAAVLDHAVVEPVGSGGALNPERVRPLWRL
jgi:DNA invertase Pin-like site-specific DNA recombinase